MNRIEKRLLAVLAAELFVFGLFPGPARASDKGSFGIRETSYADVIAKVVNMPSDYELQSRASEHGLNVVNVMWEDTGRSMGSALGPNISDLTLQVREEVDGGTRTSLLPVIRHPNFTDKTADVRADKLWVRVGNQNKGGELVAVPLTEVLANMKEYLHDADSMKGSGNMLADRDTHFLVSAQHVFVPIPRQGKAEFNPVLFNYQSAPSSPAVMTLLITREGMSATVIENRASDMMFGGGWGQQLFFNNAGQKTVFTAERRSDVKARIDRQGETKAGDKGALEEGADMMLIVQIPLKHANRGYLGGLGSGMGEGEAYESAPMDDAPPAPSAKGASRRAEVSDVERAVLGHGEDLGEFIEMNGLNLVRDKQFPVRVTVQFYKATSNGVVSEADMREVSQSIAKVYASGDYVGSLVVPESERVYRPTAWTKGQDQWRARIKQLHLQRSWR